MNVALIFYKILNMMFCTLAAVSHTAEKHSGMQGSATTQRMTIRATSLDTKENMSVGGYGPACEETRGQVRRISPTTFISSAFSRFPHHFPCVNTTPAWISSPTPSPVPPCPSHDVYAKCTPVDFLKLAPSALLPPLWVYWTHWAVIDADVVTNSLLCRV